MNVWCTSGGAGARETEGNETVVMFLFLSSRGALNPLVGEREGDTEGQGWKR